MKKVKKSIILIESLLIAILLALSVRAYCLEVKVTKENQDYNGASIKITSNEAMRKVKIYKKVSGDKFVLFYKASTNTKELSVYIPNSNLSYETTTEIKIVVYNENGERGTASATLDKVKPRVSMNPEETAKPSWTPSPIPTFPSPSTKPSQSTSPSTSTKPTVEPSPSVEPTSSTEPTEQDPIEVAPGLTKQKLNNMNYFQIIPDNPTTNMPLIVFLHGDGESSNFNSVGNLPIVKYVQSKEPFKIEKFVFIAPHQSNYTWNSDTNVKKVMAIIEKVCTDYKIDKNRIILTGMSRGGIGTWHIANKYPNFFAAIAPMSGSSSINAKNFVNTPVWAMVGSTESSYASSMQKLVNSINNASGKKLAKLEKVSGATHSTIQQSYKRPELFKWFLSQRKGGSGSGSTTGASLNVAPGTTVQKYKTMNYVQVIPDNPTENMPLIVFLHGSGERGNVNGVKNLPITTFVSGKGAYAAGKFIFIAPVVNSGNWTDSGNTNLAKELIDTVANQYKVNKKKIILTGMSNGGHGTWHLADKNPNYFSCIVPMSGFYSINPANFKTTPVWAICGTAGDLEVYFKPLMNSLVNQINNAGGSAKLEVINGAVHSTIQQQYKRVDLFKWMLSQTKK